MMKSIMRVTLAGCFLAGPALAQSMSEKTGTNSLLGMAPSTADFVTEATISDMFEIQSSQLAVQKSDAATKSFASMMVKDHQKTSDQLKSLLGSGKMQATAPTALDDSHQKMLDKLNGLNGDDFDKQYDKDQVSAHKDAVSLFKRYAKGGDSSTLRDWAGSTLPTLQAHLAMAENLRKK